MITSLEKSCSFGLMHVSFVIVYQSVCALFSLLRFENGIWDLIVLIPDHCLSICF